MIVYIETNFVFEIALRQEDHQICSQLITLAQSGQIQLVLPAYCLAEPHEKLIREQKRYKALERELQQVFSQLRRTEDYAEKVEKFDDGISLLIQSSRDARHRFNDIREKLLNTAALIPLNHTILVEAANYEFQPYEFDAQDAIVFASVLSHLKHNHATPSCFLNRNTTDFGTQEVKNELEQYNCKMMPRFVDGLRYIHTQVADQTHSDE